MLVKSAEGRTEDLAGDNLHLNCFPGSLETKWKGYNRFYPPDREGTFNFPNYIFLKRRDHNFRAGINIINAPPPLSELSKPFHRTKIGSFVKIALMGHLSNHCEKNWTGTFIQKEDLSRRLCKRIGKEVNFLWQYEAVINL